MRGQKQIRFPKREADERQKCFQQRLSQRMEAPPGRLRGSEPVGRCVKEAVNALSHWPSIGVRACGRIRVSGDDGGDDGEDGGQVQSLKGPRAQRCVASSNSQAATASPVPDQGGGGGGAPASRPDRPRPTLAARQVLPAASCSPWRHAELPFARRTQRQRCENNTIKKDSYF